MDLFRRERSSEILSSVMNEKAELYFSIFHEHITQLKSESRLESNPGPSVHRSAALTELLEDW